MKNISRVEVRFSTDGPFQINNAMAGLVPMATDTEQQALTLSIKENGQQIPITLWKNKVVDGRCRQNALGILNQNILYTTMDPELLEADVKVAVRALNTRRNLTVTQKILVAAYENLEPFSESVRSLATTWGVGHASVTNAIWLIRNFPDSAKDLFDGKAIPIISSSDVTTLSSKVNAVYAHFKRLDEAVEEDTSAGWKEDTSLLTQKAKDWYYNRIKDHKSLTIPLRMDLVELANFKYPKNT